jgi:hypothetical protein
MQGIVTGVQLLRAAQYKTKWHCVSRLPSGTKLEHSFSF